MRIEKTEVVGWEPAMRGMRNPLNSWERADSKHWGGKVSPTFGENDKKLMIRLANAGTDHGKFLRMIVVYCDITAPFFWWKEFDTYRAGVEKNSCSTMHKLASRPITMDDFEFSNPDAMKYVVAECERLRGAYEMTHDVALWRQLVEILPNGYKQKRTVMMSYAALRNMYAARKNHKLKEWHEFCAWCETLPFAELITGEER